jgi:hypothetical protein
MAITKSDELYEFLVRMEGGKIKGYHVVTRTLITDTSLPVDSQVLRLEPNQPMNVAQATAAGMSLSAIMSQVQAAAISERDEALQAAQDASSEATSATLAKESADAELEKVTAERDAALAQIADAVKLDVVAVKA